MKLTAVVLLASVMLTGSAQAQETVLTVTPLDVAVVTTGGVAVTAVAAGNRLRGGWIQNPPTATVNLCINEIGTAAGTTSAGNTVCITPGQVFLLTPSKQAVSVISSDSAHSFAGYGRQ